jgi:hypothetical protein
MIADMTQICLLSSMLSSMKESLHAWQGLSSYLTLYMHLNSDIKGNGVINNPLVMCI